jgi:phosphoenolpyruvate synthase/pyruvate phosphate dikinase
LIGSEGGEVYADVGLAHCWLLSLNAYLASRYLSPDFADCFAMECDALSYVRDQMGLTNVKIMIPFVRTLSEAEGVIRLLGEHGLKRGENDLQVIMMCELPSYAVIADAFWITSTGSRSAPTT